MGLQVTPYMEVCALILPEIGRNTAEFCGSRAIHKLTKG